MTAVSPSTATENPNQSSSAPSPGINLAVSILWSPEGARLPHSPLDLVNTYAEPDSSPLSSSRYAPTTTVLPDTATDFPKLSLSAPSEAVSLTCPAQAPDTEALVNT